MSGSTKFTSGDWIYDKYGNLIANGELLKVKGVSFPCGHSKDETDANMRLISKSPRMFKLLEDISKSNCRTEEFYEEIVEVLSEIKGESL